MLYFKWKKPDAKNQDLFKLNIPAINGRRFIVKYKLNRHVEFF